MTLLATTIIISATALSLLISNSPVILGIWILILALMTSVFLSLSITSWLSMFMFLVYVGGLLVMFSYFVALSPNQYMSLKYPLVGLLSTILLLLPLLLLPLNMNHSLSENKVPTMSFLLHMDNIPIFCLIGLTLFLALVAVVKISGGSTSPLRPYAS